MWPHPQIPADLVKFNDEILNKNFVFCAMFRQIKKIAFGFVIIANVVSLIIISILELPD